MIKGAPSIAVIALIGRIPFSVKACVSISPQSIKIAPHKIEAGIRTK
jgi:hypothetical protein